MVTANWDACDPEGFRTFRVEVYNGDKIRVFDVDRNSNVFTVDEDDPEIYMITWRMRYISFMTGWGSDGYWLIEDNPEPKFIRYPYKPVDDDYCA